MLCALLLCVNVTNILENNLQFRFIITYYFLLQTNIKLVISLFISWNREAALHRVPPTVVENLEKWCWIKTFIAYILFVLHGGLIIMLILTKKGKCYGNNLYTFQHPWECIVAVWCCCIVAKWCILFVYA